jgi:fatty acid desaturase
MHIEKRTLSIGPELLILTPDTLAEASSLVFFHRRHHQHTQLIDDSTSGKVFSLSMPNVGFMRDNLYCELNIHTI